MSKKTQIKLDDGFDLDHNTLDDFDFDFPDPKLKKDKKLSSRVSEGALKGALKSAKDPATIAATLKHLFPPGYGQVYDEADRVGQSLRSLYEESYKEIKPTIQQGKQFVTRLIPPDSKHLPKSLQKVFQRWKDEEDNGQSSAANAREAMLGASLNGIFQAQAVQHAEEKAQDEARDKVKEGIEFIRHRDILDTLNRISIATNTLEQYNSKIGVNFQKKSLELQYRQLFTLQDTLQYLQKDSQKRDNILLAISRNTLLPEHLKLQNVGMGAVKNKFQKNVLGSLIGGQAGYLDRTIAGIKDKTITGLRGITGDITSGLAAGMMALEMAESMGGDTVGEVSGGLGGGALRLLAQNFASKARKKLTGGKIDNRYGISAKGLKLEAIMQSLPQHLNEFRQDGKYQFAPGLHNRVLSWLQNLLPSMSPDTAIEVQRSGNMQQAYHYTRRTDRSINEIIPGYLARIFRELQVLRTGNDKITLTHYDHDKLDFGDDRSLMKSAKSMIAPAANIKYAQMRLDNAIKYLDKDNKLSPLAQKALREKLLKNSLAGNLASKQRLADASQYKGARPEVAAEAAAHMAQYFDTAKQEDLNTFGLMHNSLGNAVSDTRGVIQNYIDLGMYHELKQMGVLNANGTHEDLDAVANMYLERQPYEEEPSGAATSTVSLEQLEKDYEVSKAAVKKHVAAMKASAKKNLTPENIRKTANLVKQQADRMSVRVKRRAKVTGARALQAAQEKKAHFEASKLNEALKNGINKMGIHGTSAMGLINPSMSSDWYITGETSPRIQVNLLAQGQYKDKQTGKTIYSLNDIKGAVVDANMRVVLQPDDLVNLKYYDIGTSTLKPLPEAAAAATKVSKLTSVAQATTQVKNFALTKGQDLLKQAGLYDPREPVEIKVEGESHPRITVADMREGNFFDAESGKPIRSQLDIRGEVKDKQGETIIRREELGLLRFFNARIAKWSPLWMAGKLIRSMWHYQTHVAPGMAWRNLQRVGRLYANIGKGVFNTASWLAGVRIDKKPQDLYTRGSTTPCIFGKLLKQGHYWSVNTKKPIYTPGEIDGEIRDAHNQVVVTEEDYTDGLYNVEGRKVTISALKRLIRKGIGLVKRGISATARAAWNVATSPIHAAGWAARQTLKGLGSAAGSLGRGLGWMAGMRFEGSASEREKLKQLRLAASGDAEARALLSLNKNDGSAQTGVANEALSYRKTKDLKPGKLWDKIKGLSFKEINRRFGLSREEVERLETAGTEEKELKLKEQDEAEKEKGKVEENSYKYKLTHHKDRLWDRTKAAGVAAKDKAGAAGKGLLGLLGLDGIADLLGKGKDVAEGGISAVKGAGKLAKWAKLGRLGRLLGLGATAAEATGAVAGTAAVAEGAVGAGAAVAGAAATVGGGILAFLTSPVVLGAAALGLAGYGLYKGVKYLRRGKLSKLGQLRMVQYGFKGDDTAHIKSIVDLENQAKDHLSKALHGQPGIEESKWGLKDRMKLFDLDYNDMRQRERFLQWYQRRWKPVYLTHIAAVQGITGKQDFNVIEDAKPEQKKNYIQAVSFPNGPYDVKELPVEPADALAPTNAMDVKAAVKIALDEISAPPKSGKDKLAAAATAVVGAATGSTAAMAQDNAPRRVMQLSDLKNGESASKLIASGVSIIGINALSDGQSVSALDAVRFKTYGLSELRPERVQALRILEKTLEPQVTFGVTGQAAWSGDLNDLMTKVSSVFGGLNTGEKSVNWRSWFNKRFLPTYLAWMSAYKARTGKTNASAGVFALKPQDQYEIAQLVSGTKGVWSQTLSPWDISEKLNDLIDSIKPNLEYLKDAAAKATLDEQKKANSNAASSARSSTSSKAVASTQNVIDRGAQVVQQTAAAAAPDAEAKISVGSAAGAISIGSAAVGNLKLASGELMDGRNAQSFLRLNNGVTLNGLNPQMYKQLMGLIEEYGTLTGKNTVVRDGFRTYEDQVAMKKKYGARAAAPGSSLHEFGLAVDIDVRTLNEMDKMGLLRKYGFVRPVGQEPWHLEPIGIQDNISQYKQDQQAAAQAIASGAGKGGGGWGTVASATPYSRNRDLSMNILNAAIAASNAMDNDNQGKTGIVAAMGGTDQPSVTGFAAKTAAVNPATPAVIPIKGGLPVTQTAGHLDPALSAYTRAGRAMIAANDGEFGVANGAGQPLKAVDNDPTIKVPAPRGAGIDGLRDTITAAAKLVGVDSNMLLRMAAVESDFNPNAAAGTSTAQGLFQFTQSTWGEMIGKYGKQYGYTLANTSPTDAKAASIMAAHYLKDNLNGLSRATNKQLTVTDAYLTHFLGQGGAIKFLNGLQSAPTAPANQMLPGEAKSNPGIFFDGSRALNLSEVYQRISDRIESKAKRYGIDGGAIAGGTMLASAGKLSASIGPTDTSLTARITPNTSSVGSTDDAIATKPLTVTPPGHTSFSNPPNFSMGMTSATAASRAIAQPQAAAVPADLMKNTEGLLQKQLDVQSQILQVVQQLANSKGAANNVDASNADSNKVNDVYKVPDAPLTMQRKRFGST